MSALSLWKVRVTGENFTAASINLGPAQRNLDEISLSLPNGVYSTFRTYDYRKILSLEHHFARLVESSSLLDKPVEINFTGLRNALRFVLNEIPDCDLRIRITLDLEDERGVFYLSTEPLQVPLPEVYQEGSHAVTYQLQRSNPKAKQTNHLRTAAKIKSEYGNRINEILMVSPEGIIQEGLSSNFYAVMDGALWTAEQGVLLGTIRSVVLKLAENEKIPILLQGIDREKLPLLDEAFITSTSRSILPVVRIDQQTIGDGKPGVITRKLIQLYQEYIDKELESV